MRTTRASSILVLLLLTLGGLSTPAVAQPTVREVCGVYPDTRAPALSAVACAAVYSDIDIVSCGELVGGNETQPNVGYGCTLSVDWQFVSPRVHGVATQVSAEFRVHGTMLQRQNVLVPAPSLRLGPLLMGLFVDGSDPEPVVAELCVARATPFEGELDETCTRWTAVVLAPEAGASGDPTDLPLAPVGEILDAVTSSAEDLGRENAMWNALNSTYDTSLMCRPSAPSGSTQPWCNQLTGHYGYGQVRFGCKSPRIPASALQWDTFRRIASEVDGSGATHHPALPAPLYGASACDGAYDHANATAAAYGPIVPALLSHA